MIVRPGALVAVLLAAVLAGCASDAPSTGQGTDTAPEVEATSTTGGIRGVVVDQAIVPIAGVTVKVQATDKEATTNADGAFVFSGLDPGTYFVEASHPLYDKQQQTAVVEAGVSNPQALRIQLQRLITEDPAYQTLRFDGYITCSTNIDNVGYSEECGEGVGYPCDLPPTIFECGDRIGRQDGSQPQIWFRTPSDNPKSIIVEQHWTPSVSVATGNTEEFYTRIAIDWFCDPFCGGDTIVATTAPSPLHLYAGPDELGDRNVTVDTDLSTFVYSGAENGVIIEQSYEQFVTFSWGLPMPADWSFIAQSPDPF